jgi:hypothetical protein
MTRETNSIHRIDHWVSVEAYAIRSKIGHPAVYNRVKRKAISCVKIDDWVVIDVLLSSPAKKLPYHLVAPSMVQPVDMPPFAELVRVSAFCDRNNVRSNTIFSDIILGKMVAWCFADQVFVKDGPELRQYLKPRRRR